MVGPAVTRHICYISGTRADFGLMQAALQQIHSSPGLKLSVVATGMHLSPEFGMTVDEIVKAGLNVAARIPVMLEPRTGATMARNIGHMTTALVDKLTVLAPDAVMLLGDRGEMIAGALAAIHLNMPVVHIHGGERSGTVDEPVRHAISKLSHFHFVATEASRERLIRMGELAERIFVTGAPGLDGLAQAATIDRATLLDEAGFAAGKPMALFVFHPVLQEADAAGLCVEHALDVLTAKGYQVVALRPNADGGSAQIDKVLRSRSASPAMRVITHLPRETFVSWMAAADLMIGNSSAGIIEAATFGTPVINIGSRQNLRERNTNVIDSPPDAAAIERAIGIAMAHGRYAPQNVYGDGKAAGRIVSLLKTVPLDKPVLAKHNAY